MNRTALAMALGAILATPALADTQPRTLFDSPRHGIEDKVFYFVLPDRFHDGNPGNNQGDPNDPHAFGGYDPADKGMLHGGDIAGLIALYRDHPVLRRGIQMARPNSDDYRAAVYTGVCRRVHFNEPSCQRRRDLVE